MSDREKPLIWIGSAKRDLLALPVDVRKFFGHALDFAQRGGRHDAAKILKGFGGAGVLEVVEDDAGGTYRAVYTVKFEEVVFVLHCFHKKSKSGIATPRGHEHHSRQAKNCRDAGKGATKWQSALLAVSQLKLARATFLPTWVCRVPTSC